jgi:hypothetical protein
MSHDSASYNENEGANNENEGANNENEGANNENEGANNENNIEMNNIDNSWRFKPLYIDTKHFCAPKTNEILTSDKLFARQHRPHIYPSSVPVIVKDTTRPYTYYTMKSYGHAQDNNYYVNFDDHVSTTATPGYNNNAFETNQTISTDDSCCGKTYLCSILGCFACCLFLMKPV